MILALQMPLNDVPNDCINAADQRAGECNRMGAERCLDLPEAIVQLLFDELIDAVCSGSSHYSSRVGGP